MENISKIKDEWFYCTVLKVNIIFWKVWFIRRKMFAEMNGNHKIKKKLL